MRRVAAFLGGAAMLGTVLAALAAAHLWLRERTLLDRLARSWEARVAIEGPSMEPTIAAGDWLLVDPLGYAAQPPVEDDLVLAPDPRDPALVLIKRVVSVDPDGWLRLEGDDPLHSTDSRTFGAIDPARVAGKPWFRYWPPHRVGRID